jgi:hypothetical protein
MTPQQTRPRSTTSKLLGLLAVVLCFEVGVFLVVFPWMDAWSRNSIPVEAVYLLDLWENNYFRGALSGLGFVNIWISFQEMLRLLRG